MSYDGYVASGSTCAVTAFETSTTCSGEVTYDNAEAFCASYGMRVCTMSEILSGIFYITKNSIIDSRYFLRYYLYLGYRDK